MNKSITLPFFIALCHIPIFLLRFEEKREPTPPKKKITINTIHLLEELPKKNLSIQSITASPKVMPIKKVIATAKKLPKKKVIAKKAPVKKKVLKKLPKKKIQRKPNKSIALSKPFSKKKRGNAKKIIKKDAGKGQREYNLYMEQVAHVLSGSLTLPEKGKVKLAITIKPSGKVIKIESLSSESAYNLAYLKNNLASLTFPKYTKTEDRTFTIVFCDEK